MLTNLSQPMTAEDFIRYAQHQRSALDALLAVGEALGRLQQITGMNPIISFPDVKQEPQGASETASSDVAAMEPSASQPARSEPLRAPSWAGLTPVERRIVQHVEGLTNAGFAPEDDLHLVEMLTNGSKLASVAEFLGFTEAVLLARWEALVRHPDVRAANGKGASINGQQRLLAALRYRVEEAGQAAA